MFYNASLFAVLLASVASLILGFVWYSPKVFGTAYRKLQPHFPQNQNPESIKRQMTRGAIVMFISGMLQASVLYFLILITRAGSLDQFMTLVFLTWAGFQLSGIATDVMWKGLSPKLIIIDAFFGLFSNILMVFILLLIL